LVATLQDVARDPNATSSKILWALPKEEVKAMLETYRKIYLVSMHRHMLHQIVSGVDSVLGMAQPQYEYDPNLQIGKGGTGFTGIARQSWDAAINPDDKIQRQTDSNKAV
jgi:hypothetical protein